MTKLGISYSPKIDNWLKVLKLVDTVEIANLSYLEMTEDKPWTYHLRQKDPYDQSRGSLNLLKTDDVKVALEKSQVAILKKRPEIMSVHLGPATLQTGKDPVDNHIIGLGEPLFRYEIMARLSESVNCLARFTDDLGIPLAVENLDYHTGGAYKYVCDPEFICEFLQKNQNVFLLLDIAHAEISGTELRGLDPELHFDSALVYLKKLPLNRVIEVHVNSPIWQNADPLDIHLPITDDERALLKRVALSSGFQIVNLECEQDIEQQLGNLRKEMSQWKKE